MSKRQACTEERMNWWDVRRGGDQVLHEPVDQGHRQDETRA